VLSSEFRLNPSVTPAQAKKPLAPVTSNVGQLKTPSRLSYRTALQSDTHDLVEVHFAAVHAIDSKHYSDEVKLAWSPPPDAARHKWLSNLISQDSTICTIAVLDHQITVGFCIALPLQAKLLALYVHPDYSGSGVGRTLLQCVEARCHDMGLETLELRASCNAEALYRRAGYEVIGPITQQLTDALSMAATHMVKRWSSR
jgi:ribosomal protein S18 acetylase RimI-like enzyme